MKKEVIAQLKQLQTKREGGSPDAEWLSSTRETLLLQIKNTVNETASQKTGFKAFAEFVNIFKPENMTRAIATPLAVVLLMFGTWMGGSSLVSASRNTLPGETLYNVKLLSERVSLQFASGTEKTERRLEIAGRRLDEMVRVAGSSDFMKEDKLAALSGRFSDQLAFVRKDLNGLQSVDGTEETVLLALRVDTKADEYQKLFKEKSFVERPAMRLALLSLDQVSVKALELLVEGQANTVNSLPEAQLTANVEESIETFASRVALTEGDFGGIAVPESRIQLTEKAKTAVEEAKELFSQGDFKAAVRKVIEGTELVTEAETAEEVIEEPVETEVATGTEEITEEPVEETPLVEEEQLP